MKKYIIILLSILTLASSIAIGQIKPIRRGQKPKTEKAKTKSSKQSKGKGQVKSSNSTNTINVYSEEQFLKALGSNRTIVLQKSINLSTALEDSCLILSGYNNLSIKGVTPSIRLFVTNGDVLVLDFDSCNNISISNLIMGHEYVDGCEWGVLDFSDCSGINISKCDIYGCGYWGISFENTDNVVCTNCNIHDCGSDMIEISNSSNIKVSNTIIKNSWYGTMVEVKSSKQIQFINCSFIDDVNTGQESYIHKCFELDCNITLTTCTIHSRCPYGNINLIKQSGCKWY